MWNRLIPLARSPIGDSMADPRIIDVQLDERTILWRSADVEQERRIAIYDLLEGNHFAPRRPHDDGYAGPYRLTLAVEEGRLARSEEHTSELQSLMRISYAVFCLKKKNKLQHTPHDHHTMYTPTAL